LSRLRKLAAKYAVALDVEAVRDIQAWCDAHGVPENNPFRSAKVVKNNETGRFLVLLADPITPHMTSSTIEAMLLREHISNEEARRLTEPLNFLSHLFLHEIAHALDSRRSERDCDRWALEQMGPGITV
jgi:hypothetical protein